MSSPLTTPSRSGLNYHDCQCQKQQGLNKLYWLHEVQPSDQGLVGDKAFYLSQFLRSGYPVIPGFVISAAVWREFLSTIHWLNPLFADLATSSLHLNLQDAQQLSATARQIRQTILGTEVTAELADLIQHHLTQIPTRCLILRPSLFYDGHPKLTNHNFSGLLETQICPNTLTATLNSLKQVWAEMFRARSLTYWQRQGIELQHLSLGVLIQPLYPANISGTLQADGSHLWVQATWGLGMSLVRGEVTADRYQITLEDGTIQTQTPGWKTYTYHLLQDKQAPLLKAEAIDLLLPHPDLQTYLLPESDQQQYCLNSDQLHGVIQLAQSLQRTAGTRFRLEWLLQSSEPEPTLWLTQISPGDRLSAISPTLPSSITAAASSQPPLLRGVAAAGKHVIGRACVVPHFIPDLEIAPGSIIVMPNLTPDWLPLLRHVAGIVTEQGGMTSHGAILARELGLVAVVAALKATQKIQTGDLILVDGEQGEIYAVDEATWNPEDGLLLPTASTRPDLPDEPITAAHPIATQLMVNLNQLSTLDRVINLPIDGIGLLRSELILLEALEGKHPTWWLAQGRACELIDWLTESVRQISQAIYPRPVFYRSLDLRSQEFQNLTGNALTTSAAQSMLGLRGTFNYLVDPTWFDLELKVFQQLYQAGLTNLRLMLPFVRTVEEFRFCRQRVEQAGLTQFPQFQFWIMAEVPSVLFLLPEYVQAGVQGISIGSNDLTQLILGVDREEGQLANAFDTRHPAVLRAITQLIEMAKQAGIPCSICGQAPAQYPEIIDLLIQHGIHSISVEVSAIEQTYWAIRRSEQRLILQAARQNTP